MSIKNSSFEYDMQALAYLNRRLFNTSNAQVNLQCPIPLVETVNFSCNQRTEQKEEQQSLTHTSSFHLVYQRVVQVKNSSMGNQDNKFRFSVRQAKTTNFGCQHDGHKQ